MEVNVLADLLKITQEHKQYVMLDPVLQNPNIVKPSYQLYSKKKVAIFPKVLDHTLYIVGSCISRRYPTRRRKKFEYHSWGAQQ